MKKKHKPHLPAIVWKKKRKKKATNLLLNGLKIVVQLLSLFSSARCATLHNQSLVWGIVEWISSIVS